MIHNNLNPLTAKAASGPAINKIPTKMNDEHVEFQNGMKPVIGLIPNSLSLFISVFFVLYSSNEIACWFRSLRIIKVFYAKRWFLRYFKNYVISWRNDIYLLQINEIAQQADWTVHNDCLLLFNELLNGKFNIPKMHVWTSHSNTTNNFECSAESSDLLGRVITSCINVNVSVAVRKQFNYYVDSSICTM